MHIILYKPGIIPIPPKLYGGIERVIYWLGKALVALGHQVTLIGNAQSHIPGVELRAIAAGENDPRAWLRLVPDSADIVHLHVKPRQLCAKPFLLTAHGNGQPGEQFHPNTVFVSQKQAANHGSCHFVHNGLDPGEYAFSEKREDYAVFVAKARWKVKNFPGAVDVARRAGIELRVLGSRNWPFDLQKLLPPFRGVRYYGMTGAVEKRDLLARARCLIFPVRWEEPFGISTIEALVSGAYVAGTAYGSLPEIITRETGVLSPRADELVEAVKNPQRFSPAVCRNRVLRNGFTHLDMACKYVECYERILAHGSLDDGQPIVPFTRPGFVSNQLLAWSD